MPGSPEKKQESKDAQKVVRRLAQRLKALGFERTKPSFITLPRELVVEFVHVHKFTFGPCFRVHLGIRVKKDEHAGAHLNGPCSDSFGDPATNRRLYSFDYTADPESFDACAQAMFAFIESEGIKWFGAFAAPQDLLYAPETPLNMWEQDFLRQALQDPTGSTASAATQNTFGIV